MDSTCPPSRYGSPALPLLLLLGMVMMLSGCGPGSPPSGGGQQSIDTSNPPPANPWLALNDTGIVTGGNYPSGNNIDCSGETIAQQDCRHGRDFTHNDDSDGHAGFSFTKLDANGNDLPATASVWSCVRDNVTGLVWEVKQGGNGTEGDEGLHDADDSFTWYNTDTSGNGGTAGTLNENGATCHGYKANTPSSYCNTQAYVARVNTAGLCGASDWRLPSEQELTSLVNFARKDPAIDVNYFPNTRSWGYWSSLPDHGLDISDPFAWTIFFNIGAPSSSLRSESQHVRLVLGNAQ